MSGAEGQSPGIGRERQFEINVGGARGTHWDVPAYVSAAGQEGVREVVRNLRADFDLTLGLAGHTSVVEIGRESVSREG